MNWYQKSLSKTADNADRVIMQQLDAYKLRNERNVQEVVHQMQTSPGIDPEKLAELEGDHCTVYFPVAPDEGIEGISWSYGVLQRTGNDEYTLQNTEEGDWPITGLTPQSVSKIEGRSIFVKALYQ